MKTDDYQKELNLFKVGIFSKEDAIAFTIAIFIIVLIVLFGDQMVNSINLQGVI